MRTNPARGSHLPVLMTLLPRTSGSVLELGCGMYSTPYLHWACHPRRRRLVTIESDPQWFSFIRQFQTDWHEVRCIDDWDATDVSEPWSVVLVDHSPSERRWRDLCRVAHAEFVVAHDAENSQNHKYGYARAHKLYRYRAKYTDVGKAPFTGIFSNTWDVRRLKI